MHVALIEPYYGGSHAAFTETIRRHSRHRWTLLSLPARKWKWRMRGSGIWFARTAPDWLGGSPETGPVELILCSDMLPVADFRALLPPSWRSVPVVCYFHENQLTYPLPSENERDYQFGVTNITSCLAADAAWFNAATHRDDFLEAVDRFLRRMPDFVPDGIVSTLRCKSSVCYPPVELPPFFRRSRPPRQPVRILWSHRWEYDKNPEPFFAALLNLVHRGIAFELVLAGEQFRTAPPSFASALLALKDRVVHSGHEADRTVYIRLLSECDLVCSTAWQETFGISVVEAIAAGCQPLLPNRLSYPEIIPRTFHDQCLYPEDRLLEEQLTRLLEGRGWLTAEEQARLSEEIQRVFGVPGSIKRFDEALEAVLEAHKSSA